MRSTDPPVIVEQEFNVPIDQLWRALTEPEQMRQWFFAEMSDFQHCLGFETRFTIEHDDREYVHHWEITEVVENEKIVSIWQYKDCPGKGLVVWELSPSASGSRLKLTNEILESFPQDDPAFERENCEGGWNYFIKEQLPAHLN